MDSHAPGGIGWHEYHANRIYNAVEYLKLNEYFTDYGFSIWVSCYGCDLSSSNWKDDVYLSQPALFYLWPYIMVNHIFGSDALFILGPLIDKAVVFCTAVLISEYFIRSVCGPEANENAGSVERFACVTLPVWWLGLAVFTLYVTSIWSYQMQRAMWNEIWFLFLFCFSLLSLLREKFVLGCLLVFVASLMHYMSGFILGAIFIAFGIVTNIYRERSVFVSFMTPALQRSQRIWIYSLCALFPTLIYFALRALYVTSTGRGGTGSSLLWRIGISGDDLHNGGMLGALQFFGGARISKCISMLSTEGLQNSSLVEKISAFNCSLSILSMFLLSSLSVLGVIWLLRAKPSTRPLLFPVAMILLVTVAVLQQSFSVHLLGHSYPFALAFACGLIGIQLKGADVIQSPSLSLVVFTPIVIACVLLSIRVSMLAGLLG